MNERTYQHRISGSNLNVNKIKRYLSQCGIDDVQVHKDNTILINVTNPSDYQIYMIRKICNRPDLPRMNFHKINRNMFKRRWASYDSFFES
jgi:hypothetical protein